MRAHEQLHEISKAYEAQHGNAATIQMSIDAVDGAVTLRLDNLYGAGMDLAEAVAALAHDSAQADAARG